MNEVSLSLLLDPVRLSSLVLLAGWLAWRRWRTRRVRRLIIARLERVAPTWWGNDEVAK